jgi:predicted lipoprotein with Yx(FWY)xxD motif/catechol 2,3-dioxygenase-like lactoylglutathione lyase family enzyme
MPTSDQRGHIVWTQAEIEEHERQPRPRFTALAHVSMPALDLDRTRRFYEEVLGGRTILHLDDFMEVVVAGTILGFSLARGTPQAPEAEFPHVAFAIDSDQVLPMKQWLEKHGVATHQVWTRGAVEALMYFKDPNGNLFEIYCKKYDGADELPRAPRVPAIVDLRTLSYDGMENVVRSVECFHNRERPVKCAPAITHCCFTFSFDDARMNRTDALLVAAVLALPACGGGSSGVTAQPGPLAALSPTPTIAPPLQTATVNGAPGFVTAAGLATYVFDADLKTPGQSACVPSNVTPTGTSCSAAWPPVPKPAAVSSLPSGWDQIARPDNVVQLTYQGRPLYTFVRDTSPGVANGEGGGTAFGGPFHIARPVGVTNVPTPTAAPTAVPTPTPTNTPTPSTQQVIGMALPTGTMGSLTDPTYGLIGGYTQATSSQVLFFAPSSQVMLKNLSNGDVHTLNVINTTGPFPANPALSPTASGGSTLSAGFASGSVNSGALVGPITLQTGTYWIGCAFHYASNSMRDVLIVGTSGAPGPQATPNPTTSGYF